MKKVAVLFVVAVFVPSVVLAALAIRSLRHREIVQERQQAVLFQRIADDLARQVNDSLHQAQQEFAREAEALIKSTTIKDAAVKFDQDLQERWPLAEVGFIVTRDGAMLAPSLFGSKEARRFRLENERFLTSRETVEMYWESPKGLINLSKLDRSKEVAGAEPDKALESQFREFRQVVQDERDGILARFLQDRLNVLFWHKAAEDLQVILGAEIHMPALVRRLAALIRIDTALSQDIQVALLDDAGRVLSTTGSGPHGSAARPLVVAPIGDTLPHWQTAVYLVNPAKWRRSAGALGVLFALLVGLLLIAIALGGALIVIDLKRQLHLARQKTDFVSNVSHELKTPLTSIRMFTELLAEGRVHEEAKRNHYLRIISAETARLTRLINNVLDFSRMERGEKKYRREPVDLAALALHTFESYQLSLKEAGFSFSMQAPEVPVVVEGDPDALAQVLVNLLSNAEKYAGARKEIAVEVLPPGAPAGDVQVRVSDRGLGIPDGCEEKIFEQFYRAHDALSSGIQGSGLGLTLARQIARAHGGDISVERRAGGGSCFTLRLPARSQT